MEVKITNSWLFREYLSAINENLGILATIFIAISRGLVAIKARFLVRDITREQRRFGGFLARALNSCVASERILSENLSLPLLFFSSPPLPSSPLL
ncbi:uncharacterized protein METZ01_LOCUS495426, partial [marine metagenome]